MDIALEINEVLPQLEDPQTYFAFWSALASIVNAYVEKNLVISVEKVDVFALTMTPLEYATAPSSTN